MVDTLSIRADGHKERADEADAALEAVWDAYSRRLQPLTWLGRTATGGSAFARERFLHAVYQQTAWPE
jgi:hypothetical protein